MGRRSAMVACALSLSAGCEIRIVGCDSRSQLTPEPVGAAVGTAALPGAPSAVGDRNRGAEAPASARAGAPVEGAAPPNLRPEAAHGLGEDASAPQLKSTQAVAPAAPAESASANEGTPPAAGPTVDAAASEPLAVEGAAPDAGGGAGEHVDPAEALAEQRAAFAGWVREQLRAQYGSGYTGFSSGQGSTGAGSGSGFTGYGSGSGFTGNGSGARDTGYGSGSGFTGAGSGSGFTGYGAGTAPR
jgi:hypothetical protein